MLTRQISIAIVFLFFSIPYCLSQEIHFDKSFYFQGVEFTSEEEKKAIEKLLENPHEVLDYLKFYTRSSSITFSEKVELYLENHKTIVEKKEDLNKKIDYVLMTVHGDLLKYEYSSKFKDLNEKYQYNEFTGSLYLGVILYQLDIPFYLFFKEQTPYFNIYPHVKECFVQVDKNGISTKSKDKLEHDETLITYQLVDTVTNFTQEEYFVNKGWGLSSLIAYQNIKVEQIFVADLLKKTVLINPYIFRDKSILKILSDKLDFYTEFSSDWFDHLLNLYKVYCLNGINIDEIVENDFYGFREYWLNHQSEYVPKHFFNHSQKMFSFIQDQEKKEDLEAILKGEQGNFYLRMEMFDDALEVYHQLDSTIIKYNEKNYSLYLELSAYRMYDALVKGEYDFINNNYIKDHYKDYIYIKSENDYKLAVLEAYIVAYQFYEKYSYREILVIQFDKSISKNDRTFLVKGEVEIIQMYVDYCVYLKSQKKFEKAGYYLKRCKTLFPENIEFIEEELSSKSNK